MFEIYLSRAEAMHNESALIFAFVIGCIMVVVTFLVIGLMLWFHKSAKHKALRIYRPLAYCFLGLVAAKILEIVAVWYNYAWLIAIANIICGVLGWWVLWLLPDAIIQRRNMVDCDDLRKEKEDLEKKIEELKDLKNAASV